MNSRQLRWILTNDKVTSRTFRGVFALDEIVHIKQKSFPLHTFLIWIRVTSLVVTGLQSTLIGKDVLNISILLVDLPQEKSKTFVYLCRKLEIQSRTRSRILFYDMWSICCVLCLSKIFWFNFGSYHSKIF